MSRDQSKRANTEISVGREFQAKENSKCKGISPNELVCLKEKKVSAAAAERNEQNGRKKLQPPSYGP